MKRIASFIIGFVVSMVVIAQTPLQVVQSYGENLHFWSETGSMVYRENIKVICKGKKEAIFKDQLTRKLAKEKYGDLDFYQLATFINCIDNKVGEHISIQVSNLKQRNDSEIEVTNSNTRSFSYGKKSDDELRYVSCDISITGATFNYHGSQLIYVRNGKITKVDDCVVVTTSTGEKKIKVDLSDMMDDLETFGVTYNYGKNWPIGLSLNYSYSMFMVGLDIGVNLDKDKLNKHKLEMTDVMNYTKEDIEYDPLFFATVTPSFYLKYFSIGCGAGILYLKGTKHVSSSKSSSYSNISEGSSISVTSSSHSSYDEDCTKVKFMLRPSIKGFIPLSNEWYLSLSVGYDYAFGYREKNGVNFGIGLQYALNW
jgi:hypothetical protein